MGDFLRLLRQTKPNDAEKFREKQPIDWLPPRWPVLPSEETQWVNGASGFGHERVLEVLLRLGASTEVPHIDRHGTSTFPLEEAVKERYPSCVKTLLKHGANAQ